MYDIVLALAVDGQLVVSSKVPGQMGMRSSKSGLVIAKCDRSVDGIDVRDWVLGVGSGGFLRGKEHDRHVSHSRHSNPTPKNLSNKSDG